MGRLLTGATVGCILARLAQSVLGEKCGKSLKGEKGNGVSRFEILFRLPRQPGKILDSRLSPSMTVLQTPSI
jgi:hypothetical protein